MTALGQYSDTHIVAFKKWQRVGSTEITEADLDAIEREDSATGAHIRQERMKAAQKRADELRAKTPAPTPPAQRVRTNLIHLQRSQLERFIDAYSKAFDGDTAEWNAVVKEFGGLAVPLAIFDTLAVRLTLSMNAKNQERNKRIDALEQGAASNERGVDTERRLRALEERLVHRGLWEAGISYPKGAPVTWDGSMWIAAEPTRGIQPGDKSQPKVWILAVQRGREGRCKCPR